MPRKSKTVRNVLLVAVKLLIATVLLGWVLWQVHWSDYVRDRQGQEYNLLGSADGRPGHLRVYTGILWWQSESVRPSSEFVPVSETTSEVRRWGFVTTIMNIRVALAVPAFFGMLVCLLLLSVRWRVLLKAGDVEISAWEAVRLTFLGQFFNAVIPGTVGGDLVKAYYVSKHTSRKAAVLVSILMDRVLGLGWLGCLAGTVLVCIWLTGAADREQLRMPAILVVVVLGLVTLTFLFVLSSRFRRVLHLQRLYRRLPIARYLAAAGEAARLYRRRLGAVAAAVGITTVGQVIWIGSLCLIGRSLSLPTPWYNYFVYIPLIYIIGAVPLTPGGVGLVEKFYVVFFSATSSPSSILALALLARLIPMFWGLPGMIVALTGPKLPKSEAIQAELGLDEPAGQATETP